MRFRQKTLSLRERLIALRRNRLNGDAYSRTIMGDDQFWVRFRRARKRLLADRDQDEAMRDDVSQEALLSLHRYFCSFSFPDLERVDDDEFGGWLYTCCRRHLAWALGRWLRARGREYRIDEFVEPHTGGSSVTEGEFQNLCFVVARILEGFPEPLKSVTEDYLNDVPRRRTAARLSLSENWVSQLRAKGRDAIAAALHEYLAGIRP